jgi:hypothetical protein
MKRTASRKAWLVVLGALMVLALISVPGGFVGAEEPPSEEAASEPPAPDSSHEEADSEGSSQTSAEDETPTQEDESPTQEDESPTGGEEAPGTGSSAEGSESGSAGSTGGGSTAGESEGDQAEAITVDVVKDNDADEDGTFSDSEEASEEGQDVTFQVVITNTSDVAVMIMSLKDAFGETVISPACLTAEGKNVDGMWLDPDESVTCTFTVQDYAPPAGGSLVDTVTVTVCPKGVSDRYSDSDTSEVTTPEEGPPPADITVDLVKDNDADEDGTFTDSEEASEEGQDVTFQVVITNTSDVAVEILSLSDAFGEFVFDPIPCLTSGGENVIGMVLDPDESVTCTFTILNYAPPADESLVDRVEVTVGEEGNEENQASDSDTSIVTTSEVLGGIVTPPRPGVQPPAAPGDQVAGVEVLAVTGAELALLSLLAVSLLTAGIILLYSARSGSLKQRA